MEISEDMKELIEMANLRPSFTGFKYYIWVGPNPASHGPRIKVVNEAGRLDNNNCFSVSISDNPQVVAGTSEIPQKHLNEIFAWVKLNKDDLLAHSRLEIDDDELKERLQKSKERKESQEAKMPILMEMANAPQKYTGISGVIYFCTKEEMRNKQAHSLGRVKLLKDGVSVYCSIKKGSDGERITQGRNKRLLKALQDFVEKNEDILWTYWNTPAIKADSAETIQKFRKI